MAAYEEFGEVVRATGVVQRVVSSLVLEAAQALREVCRYFEQTRHPLPDHHLPSGGYLGEMVVRALMDAEMIEEVAGERGSIRQYRPTERGLSVHRQLQEEHAFARGPSA